MKNETKDSNLDEKIRDLDLPDGYRVYVKEKNSKLHVHIIPKVGKPSLPEEKRKEIKEELQNETNRSIKILSPRLVSTTTSLGKEIKRKFIHLLGLTAPLIYLLWGKTWALLFLGVWFPTFLIFDLYRTRHGIPFEAEGILQNMMRMEEVSTIASHTYASGAFLASIFFFPKDAAIAGMLILLLADSSAAIVGTKWGETEILPNKTIAGTFTLFLVAFLVALLFVSPIIAIIGATAAAIVELGPLNDSLTIPLTSGFFMYLAIILL